MEAASFIPSLFTFVSCPFSPHFLHLWVCLASQSHPLPSLCLCLCLFHSPTQQQQQQQQFSTTPSAALLPGLLSRALELVNYMSPRYAPSLPSLSPSPPHPLCASYPPSLPLSLLATSRLVLY